MSFMSVIPAPRVRGFALIAFVLLAAVAACSSSKLSSRPDSAAVARTLADSLAQVAQRGASELEVSARATMASLLKDPKSAAFDSLMVVQPPEANGRMPAMVVCGRIRGKPGIGGRSAPSAFIYQNRMTVFVEDASNQKEFGTLWGRLCADPQARVITR
jgi:hypothetical protein